MVAGGISDFEGDERYVFCGDFDQKEDMIQKDLRRAVGVAEFTILTFRENTDGRKEANSNLE